LVRVAEACGLTGIWQITTDVVVRSEAPSSDFSEMVCPGTWVDSLDRAASAARELCEVRNSRGSAIVIDKLEVNHVDGAIFSLVVVPN
jgi:hypothetical protein